jgi:hypothetical protein
MPRFLYEYLQLFSYMGAGTPESPGGDFGMSCWIEAPDHETALKWGHVLLGDYYRARFARSEEAEFHDGSPIEQGWIVDDEQRLANAPSVPSCQVGEIPTWDEPWRHHNAP